MSLGPKLSPQSFLYHNTQNLTVTTYCPLCESSLEIDAEVATCPAEPDVGIFNPYIEDIVSISVGGRNMDVDEYRKLSEAWRKQVFDLLNEELLTLEPASNSTEYHLCPTNPL